MTIRAALGASRGRLAGELLLESTLLALLGGGAGLLLALWGVEALRSLEPGTIPRVEEIGVDLRVLGFALGLSLLTGLLFGLAPVWRVRSPGSARGARRWRPETRRRPQPPAHPLRAGPGRSGAGLRAAGRRGAPAPELRPAAAGGSRLRLRGGPHRAGEAPAACRIPSATQLARLRSSSSSPACERSPACAPRRWCPTRRWATRRRTWASRSQGGATPAARARCRTRPSSPPARATSRRFASRWSRAGSSTPSDRAGGEPVVVINRTMARRYWPGRIPLGARITFDDPADPDATWLTVVGVGGRRAPGAARRRALSPDLPPVRPESDPLHGAGDPDRRRSAGAGARGPRARWRSSTPTSRSPTSRRWRSARPSRWPGRG